jgi:hypothetical protein
VAFEIVEYCWPQEKALARASPEWREKSVSDKEQNKEV